MQDVSWSSSASDNSVSYLARPHFGRAFGHISRPRSQMTPLPTVLPVGRDQHRRQQVAKDNVVTLGSCFFGHVG
jgi:hypothetical protein